jgi:pyruvate carboxylase
MLRGNLGQPHGGWPEGILKKVLKGEAPLTERPGKTLPPVDFAATRAYLEKELTGYKVDTEDVNGYLMYPKVFLDYMGRHRLYGPVRALPTKTFFYGMEPGEEITAEIDPGKNLEIRLQAVGETTEDGDVRVFFELNGQPRLIRIPKAGAVKSAEALKAQDGNADHVGAPMPGMIVTVAVQPGQAVSKGDALVSIEAMKMETMIRAERDGIIKAVHVKTGKTVSAKDLLLEY